MVNFKAAFTNTTSMQALATTNKRITSIDLLRGIVMVIMALDHTREFFHKDAWTQDPLDLATTTPVLYFTRWITHFCAPVFVMLAGASIFLLQQTKTPKQTSAFLVKRGLWLIITELLIFTPGWTFNLAYPFTVLQVIWAIGTSMLIMAALVFLPYRVVLFYGLMIVLGHNAFDYYEAAAKGNLSVGYVLLNSASMRAIDDTHSILLGYAILPWSGIMALGYCLGKLFTKPAEIRKKLLLQIGLAVIILFVVLRFIDVYGDPLHWSKQPTLINTILSFLNVQKYPPSLLYTCITLGPALILLAYLEEAKNAVARIFRVFGSVPFFYYMLHIYLIHLLCVAAMAITKYQPAINEPNIMRPFGFGFPLWAVYIVWAVVVASLYPLCKWYSRYKSTHKHWWLGYV